MNPPEATTDPGAAHSSPCLRTPVRGHPALAQLQAARHVLLLQGPVGPFFDRLAARLQAQGSTVQRVAFHPGDVADSRCVRPLTFRLPPALWRSYLDGLLTTGRIDTIVLFGQARAHHVTAIELARQRGVAVVVMEEGYVRPGYATLELGGVNGLSTTLDRFRRDHTDPQKDTRAEPAAPAPTRHPFRDMALHACRHYWQLHWGKPLHPEYRHHRPTSIWQHSRLWLGTWLRQLLRHLPDAQRTRHLITTRYFLVPLQDDNDPQVTHHSGFNGMAELIEGVLGSFAAHAAPHEQLVFRQHPSGCGGRGHEALVRRLTLGSPLAGRVHFLVGGHTPTLVAHAAGVVVVNSTVGLQAIVQGKPLMVLGRAAYQRPGLCFGGSLDRFWREGRPPEPGHCTAFVDELVALTQVPWHLYAPRHAPLAWPDGVTP